MARLALLWQLLHFVTVLAHSGVQFPSLCLSVCVCMVVWSCGWMDGWVDGCTQAASSQWQVRVYVYVYVYVCVCVCVDACGSVGFILLCTSISLSLCKLRVGRAAGMSRHSLPPSLPL